MSEQHVGRPDISEEKEPGEKDAVTHSQSISSDFTVTDNDIAACGNSDANDNIWLVISCKDSLVNL
jgi:hypothetical protein